METDNKGHHAYDERPLVVAQEPPSSYTFKMEQKCVQLLGKFLENEPFQELTTRAVFGNTDRLSRYAISF